MNAYAQSATAYLTQRVMTANPEQQAALLMEAGQRFLGKAIQAMEGRAHLETARCLGRVTDIINESILRLNQDDEGELVQNLLKIYQWWIHEIIESSSARDTARLEVLSHHMGEIRQAWEQLHEKRGKSVQPMAFQVGDRVV